MKIRKTAAIILAVVTMLFSITVSAQTYTSPTFKDSSLKEKMKGIIVFRLNNPEAYVDNFKVKLEPADENITPVERNGKMFVPAEFLTDKIGGILTEGDTSSEVTIGEVKKTYKILNYFGSDADKCMVMYRNKLFVSIENFASDFNLAFTDKNKLAIVNMKQNASNPNIVGSDLARLSEAMEYKWSNVYLGANGFVTGIVMHPIDKSVFCRTDVGGIYEYNKEYGRWVRLTDNVYEKPDHSELKEVTGMILDPKDSNIIYIVTAAGVLKTTDRGATWTECLMFPANTGNGMRAGEPIAVDPNNSNVVYYGSDSNGLFVSEDAGKTWRNCFGIPKDADYGVRCIEFDPDSEVKDGKTQTIYVGVSGYGVYVSYNGGRSFELMKQSPSHPARMQVFDGRIYASFMLKGGTQKSDMQQGLYLYKDGIWKCIGPNADTCAFVVDEKNPDFIVVADAPFTTRHMWRTFDGGKTWEDLGSITSIADMIFEPDNPDAVYYVYGAGINRIDDIRENWKISRFDTGIEEFCSAQAMSVPGSDIKLITGNLDYGLYMNKEFAERAVRYGTPLYADVSRMDYSGQNPSFCMVVGSSSNYNTGTELMEYSTDYGKSWARAGGWDAANFLIDVAVGATVQKNGMPVVMVQAITGNKAGMYVSYDALKTWTRMENAPGPKTDISHWNRWNNHLVADKVDGNTFYIAYDNIIYLTRDAGKTWKQASAAPTRVASYVKLDAAPNMEGTLCYSGQSGLFISENYGRSWRRCKGISWAYTAAFGKGKTDKTDALYCYGTYNGTSGMFLSDDLGATWRKISSGDNGLCGPGDTTELVGDKNVYGRVYLTTHGIGTLVGQPVDLNDAAPVITVNDIGTDITGVNTLTISGTINRDADVRINNKPVIVDGNLGFKADVTLTEGENTILVEAVADNKYKATPYQTKITYNPEYVGLKLDREGEFISVSDTLTLSGETTETATVYINNEPISTDENKKFETELKLSEGYNDFTIYAVDKDGNKSAEKLVSAKWDTTEPEYEVAEINSEIDEPYIILNLKMNEDGEFRINGNVASYIADTLLEYFVPLSTGKNNIKIEARDLSKNVAKPSEYSLNSTAAKVDTENIEAKYTENEIELDGVFDEEIWSVDKLLTKCVKGVGNNVTKFDACWDENNLYVALTVRDAKLITDSESVFEDDCIEIYLDGDNCHAEKYCSHCSQMQFRYDGEVGAGGTKWASKVTNDGYTLEVAIPWSHVGVTVKEGSKVGFDINAIDDDATTSDGTRSGILTWNIPNGSAWTSPSQYATMTLVK